MSSTPPANARRIPAHTRPVRRAPLSTVISHWILVLAIAVSLATGLRIAADAPQAAVSAMLAPALPQGDVLVWHLASGASVLAVMIAYALYQTGTGLGRRFLRLPDIPRTSPAAARSARLRRLDLVSYWLALTLLLIATATGVMQYRTRPS